MNKLLLVLSILIIFACERKEEKKEIENIKITSETQPTKILNPEKDAINLYIEIEVAFNSRDYDSIPELYQKLTNEYPDYKGIEEATKMYAYSTNKKLITKDERDRQQNKEKMEKLFEHYFSYNMYTNYQMPIKTHEEMINLVAKTYKVSSNEFFKLYEDYYRDWYMERIKKIEN